MVELCQVCRSKKAKILQLCSTRLFKYAIKLFKSFVVYSHINSDGDQWLAAGRHISFRCSINKYVSQNTLHHKVTRPTKHF